MNVLTIRNSRCKNHKKIKYVFLNLAFTIPKCLKFVCLNLHLEGLKMTRCESKHVAHIVTNIV